MHAGTAIVDRDIAGNVGANHVVTDEHSPQVFAEYFDTIQRISGDDVAGNEDRVQRGQFGRQIVVEGIEIRGGITRLRRQTVVEVQQEIGAGIGIDMRGGERDSVTRVGHGHQASGINAEMIARKRVAMPIGADGVAATVADGQIAHC